MHRLCPCVVVLVLPLLGACGGGEELSVPRLRETGSSAPREEGGGEVDASDASAPTGAASDAGADASPDASPEHSGEGTYYNAEGVGACGIQTPPDYLVAAINDEQYSKANCGRCVSVDGPNGSVVVRVIDKCPGCDEGDLDLSETAFSKIADKSAGRVTITWRFVECPF